MDKAEEAGKKEVGEAEKKEGIDRTRRHRRDPEQLM